MQRGIEMSETTDPNAVRPGCQMYASAPQYGGALMVLARLWGIFQVMNPRFSLTGLMPQVVEAQVAEEISHSVAFSGCFFVDSDRPSLTAAPRTLKRVSSYPPPHSTVDSPRKPG